jgi:hypothetical protein
MACNFSVTVDADWKMAVLAISRRLLGVGASLLAMRWKRLLLKRVHWACLLKYPPSLKTCLRNSPVLAYSVTREMSSMLMMSLLLAETDLRMSPSSVINLRKGRSIWAGRVSLLR